MQATHIHWFAMSTPGGSYGLPHLLCTQHEEVRFKLYLNECKMDQLEEVARTVSDPTHERYRHFLRSDTVT